MEEALFFTPEEHRQLIALYKKILQLSGETLLKDDCHKLKNHLIAAASSKSIPRHQGHADSRHCQRRNRNATGFHPGYYAA